MKTFNTIAEAMQAALDALKPGYEIRVCSNNNQIPERDECFHSVHALNGDLYFWCTPQFQLNDELLKMVNYIAEEAERRAAKLNNPLQVMAYAAKTKDFIQQTQQLFLDFQEIINTKDAEGLIGQFKDIEKLEDMRLKEQFTQVFAKIETLIGASTDIKINAPVTRSLQ